MLTKFYHENDDRNQPWRLCNKNAVLHEFVGEMVHEDYSDVIFYLLIVYAYLPESRYNLEGYSHTSRLCAYTDTNIPVAYSS